MSWGAAAAGSTPSKAAFSSRSKEERARCRIATTMRHRVRGNLGILIGALFLASACATPGGVVRGNPQLVYRALTSSVLSTGEPSAPTAQVLHRRGVATRFEDEPEAVLAELRGTGVGLSRDRLFALAELSFAHADKAKKREYYLAAAVYAYAFLL